jgi:cytosine/adenosine deaminase-related metal-dependent hydrolase
MAKAFATKIRIPIPVGDETVVMICRKPSTEELTKFLSQRFQAKGRKVQTHLYEAREELIDKVLVDVENAEYETPGGESRPLTAATVLTDEEKTFCAGVLGRKVESWKDLIPLSWKSSAAMHFEDPQPDSEGEAEKN